tara:strand:+ start:244 stop:366 length:123 start_codon:yes stop_codon:yes gene_type:complete
MENYSSIGIFYGGCNTDKKTIKKIKTFKINKKTIKKKYFK